MNNNKSRKLISEELVVASHNPGKVAEIENLLSEFNIVSISALDIGLVEPEENGSTFLENATIKALSAAITSKIPSIADDSGLVIEDLGGDPGIYSARWAGPDKDFDHAMKRIWKELSKTQVDHINHAPKGNFTCALVLAWPDGHTEEFEGHVNGTIVWPPRGNNGFGYDPIFVADGHKRTFGEMDPSEKHAISHRAKAFEKLIDDCINF